MKIISSSAESRYYCQLFHLILAKHSSFGLRKTAPIMIFADIESGFDGLR